MPGQHTFTRDRLTWLMYLMLGYYAYFLAAIGVAVPYLRTELSLTFAMAGLHSSMAALGGLLATLVGHALINRFSRRTLFWAGSTTEAALALLLILGQSAAITLAAAALMGFFGMFVLIIVQSALSDHHGAGRAVAFAEANITASLLTALPPAAISLGSVTVLGWRLSFVLGMLLWLILFLIYRGTPLPRHTEQDLIQAANAPQNAFPMEYWLYWVTLFFAVSIEWSIIVWGADFLRLRHEIPAELASLAMSGFFGAMLAGRIIGSVLTRWVRSRYLLLGALVLVAGAFPLYWLTNNAGVALGGLVIVGLGVANLWPQGLGAAMNRVPDKADAASARISLASASGILIMPLILGAVADQVGIFRAHAVIPVLLVCALAATVLAIASTAAKETRLSAGLEDGA